MKFLQMAPPEKALPIGRSAHCIFHHFAWSGWNFARKLGRGVIIRNLSCSFNIYYLLSLLTIHRYLRGSLWIFMGNVFMGLVNTNYATGYYNINGISKHAIKKHFRNIYY